jgi:stringent starvation protein B
VFGRFIDRGKVMVTLDARRPGVTVPTHFAEESQLNLDFSERFGLADFVYDERGVRASLSFNRQPFFCDVPWSSVYSLFSHAEDGERLTWPRSLPSEILEQLPEASIEHLERVLELQVEKLLRQQREHHERELRAEPPEPAAAEASADDNRDTTSTADATTPPPEPTSGDDKPPPRGPGLRLVK